MGVSSSAALEVATLRGLEVLAGKSFTGTALARLAQRAENEIVGAACGLMDQLAVAHGRVGELLPILCRPDVLHERVRLPEGAVVVGWPSGVRHAVADSPYATARAAAFMARPIPVFPLVGSTTCIPGFSLPVASASQIIDAPMRHFTE